MTILADGAVNVVGEVEEDMENDFDVEDGSGDDGEDWVAV